MIEMKTYELNITINDEDCTKTTSSFPVAYELELHRLIELDAYSRAERDGFRCSPEDYWLAAENDICKSF
jgi:hypothetical protein